MAPKKEENNAEEMKKPRGIRNHNPGNIRMSNSMWKGKIPIEDNTDREFEQFTDPVFGIRAMILLAKKHISKNGCYNIERLVEKWAPSHENNTEAYIKYVAEKSGISRIQHIRSSNMYEMEKVVMAMIDVENGSDHPYTKCDFYEAWGIA